MIPALAGALPGAEFEIAANGTAYSARIEIEETDAYIFSEPGILGEPVPSRVSGIRLEAPNGTVVPIREQGSGVITFPEGNYTLSFEGELGTPHLQHFFDAAHRANVTVPAGLNVTNPFLGGYSPGADLTVKPDGTTRLSWDSTGEVRVRFYDAAREAMLWFFASTWAVVAIVLLFPFLFDRLNRHRE
ncbi:MAG: hypothetical protein GXY82_07415 [Methanospirillum sp.]|nr:hypothetical protein [Methanospirillum sp.]